MEKHVSDNVRHENTFENSCVDLLRSAFALKTFAFGGSIEFVIYSVGGREKGII